MNSIDKYILMHEYNPIYLSQPHTLLEYSIDRWLFFKIHLFFILQICIKRHLLPSCLCLQLDRLWAVLSGTGIFLLEQRITVIRDQLAITCRTLLPINKAHCTVLFSFLYISYLSCSEFIFFFSTGQVSHSSGRKGGGVFQITLWQSHNYSIGLPNTWVSSG